MLPPDTARGSALFEIAGLVDHKNRVGRGDRLDDVVRDIAQRLPISVRATEDRLLSPGTRVPDGLGPHPAGLAPLTSEQPVQQGVGRGGDTRGGERRADARLGLPARRD